MPSWKDLQSALIDPNFHDLPIEERRNVIWKDPRASDLSTVDVDDILNQAQQRFSIPKENRYKIKFAPGWHQPVPKTLNELFNEPDFLKQPIEVQRAQARQIKNQFGLLSQEEQDKILSAAQSGALPQKPRPTSDKKSMPAPADTKILSKSANIIPAPFPVQRTKEQALADFVPPAPVGMRPPSMDEVGFWGEFGRGIAEADKSIVETAGGGLQWLGEIVGSDKLKEWGKDANEWINSKITTTLPPEEVSGSVMEKPWLMLEPKWWAREAGSFIPYAGMFAGIAAGSTVIATAALPATASTAAIATTASLLNAINNSMFIGSSQYLDEKKRGRTDEEASKSAASAAAMDLPWTFISGKFGVFGGNLKSSVITFLRNSASQGAQMGGQTFIQNLASKATGGERDLFENVGESAIKGTLMGPMVGKGVDVAKGIMRRSISGIPESLRTLEHQINATRKGNRPVIIFQDPERTPDKIRGLERYDYVMKDTNPETGEEVNTPTTFFYNKDKISPNKIKEYVDSDNLLPFGYVDLKGINTDHVVSLIDKHGNEIHSAAVKKENVETQEAIERKHFPATEKENEGSVIISGPVESIAPIIEANRMEPTIDSISSSKEKVDAIISGKEAAPEGVSIKRNEPTDDNVLDLSKAFTEEPKELVVEESKPDPVVALSASKLAIQNSAEKLGLNLDKISQRLFKKGFSDLNAEEVSRLENGLQKKDVLPTEEAISAALPPPPAASIQQPTAPEIQKTPAKPIDIISERATALDLLPEGFIIKDNNSNEYVRREKGWKKKDKNGQEKGRPILSKTIANPNKTKLSPEDLAYYIQVSKTFKEKKAPELPAPPVGDELYVDAFSKKGNLVNVEAMPEVPPSSALNPEEILLRKEAEEREAVPGEVTVTTEKPKTVKVFKRKEKTLPPPVEAKKELPSPEAVAPETPVKPTPNPFQEPAISYEEAVANREKARTQLSELEVEGQRRAGGNENLISSTGQRFLGTTEELMSRVNRLRKTVSKLDNIISDYENKKKLEPPPVVQSLEKEPAPDNPFTEMIMKEEAENKIERERKAREDELNSLRAEFKAASTDPQRDEAVNKIMERPDGIERVNEIATDLLSQASTLEEKTSIEENYNRWMKDYMNDSEKTNEEISALTGHNDNFENAQEMYLAGAVPKKQDPDRNIRAFDNKTGNVLGVRGIIAYLKKALDVPTRLDSLAKKKKGILGLFKESPETIHLNSKAIQALREIGWNEIDVMSHEVGHYYNLLAFKDGDPNNALSFGKVYDAELFRLAERPIIEKMIKEGKTSKEIADALSQLSPEYKRNEGSAEFFRYYLTDKAKAMAEAKNFYDFVKHTTEERFPAVNAIFENSRKMIEDFNNLDLAGQADTQILSNPEEANIAPRQSVSDWLLKMRVKWVDTLAPIYDNLEKLASFTAKELDIRNINDIKNRFFNFKGLIESQVDHAMLYGMIDLNGTIIGDSLASILNKPEVKSDMNGFRRFIVAMNAYSMEHPNASHIKPKASGFDPKWIDAEMNTNWKKFLKPAKELAEWNNKNLHLLVEGGVATEDRYNAMVRERPFYAPMYRVVELLEGAGIKAPRPGRGFVDLPAGAHRAKGVQGPVPVIDPIRSSIHNALVYRAIAQKNSLMLRFLNAATTIQGGGRVLEGAVKKVRTEKISDNLIRARLQKLGVDTETLENQIRQKLGLKPDEDVGLGLTLYHTLRYTSQEKASQGLIDVYDKGKIDTYKIDDPMLYKALTTAEKSNILDEGLTKPLRALTNTLRAGAVWNPSFMMKNLFKDQISAAINHHYGYIPYYDGIKGLFSVFKEDQWFQDFMRYGGRHSDLVANDKKSLIASMNYVLNSSDGLAKRFGYRLKEISEAKGMEKSKEIWDLVSDVTIGALQEASSKIEEATRVSVFRHSIKTLAKREGLRVEDILPDKGPSVRPDLVQEAVKEAKDSTLNYARSGEYGKNLNKVIAFFNASIQDISKIAREHTIENLTSGKYSKNIAMRAGLWVTLPSIIAWTLGKDDEKIKNLPAWRKNMFWNLHLGRDISDPVLSIPKPFLLGIIYGSSVERFLDYMTDRDPNAIKSLVGAAWKAAEPGWMPTAASPFIENLANYSFYRGQKLESPSMERLPDEERFYPDTSQISKFTARAMGGKIPTMESPIKIDNYIRGWFGGLGQMGINTLDYATQIVGAQSVPKPPAKTLPEIPVVKSLFVSPYTPSDYVRRFYDASDIAQKTINAFVNYDKSGNANKISEFWEKNKEKIAYYNINPNSPDSGVISKINNAKKELTEINRAISMIRDSFLSKDEKRGKILELQEYRDNMAKMYFLTLFRPEEQEKVY
jgi:hypothetical protein